MTELALYTAIIFAVAQVEANRVPAAVLTRDSLFSPGESLVQAVRLDPDRTRYRVMHVYVGPQSLKNRIVTGEFRFYGRRLPTNPRYAQRRVAFDSTAPPEAVFWVSVSDDAKPLVFKYTPWAWQSAVDTDPDYPMSVRECQALQAVYEAKDKQRLRVVDGYIRGQDAMVALTVLIRLMYDPNAKTGGIPFMPPLSPNINTPSIAAYLRGLARDPSLSVLLQMDVEHALESTKGWPGSKEQAAMFRRWFGGAWVNAGGKGGLGSLDQSVEDCVVVWLSSAARQRRYPLEQIIGLAIAGVANPHRSVTFKQNIIGELSNSAAAPWTPQERQDVFALLVRNLKTDAPIGQRVAAAQLLKTLAPFSAAETGQIRNLLAAVQDESLARELRPTLEK